MKISFVIPTYNYGCYIKHCLQAIIEQGDDDYEIIVVDDGSTDETCSIIEDYSQGLAAGQLRYYYQANSGPSVARNNGAFQARGEFVWFVDADDRLAPGALQHVLEAIENSDQVDFLYGGHYYVNEKGKKATRPASTIGCNMNESFEKLIKGKLKGLTIGSLIVRRSVFERLRFPEGVHNNEDNIFYGHLLAGSQGVSLPGILVEVICHKDSLRYNARAIKDSGFTADRLFDDKVLNNRQMALKNIYLSNNYYSMFRTLYREKEYHAAFRFYLKAISAYPGSLFNLHRLKQAVRCLVKMLKADSPA